MNKNYVGVAPPCLTDLTEVELAFLTPVKHCWILLHLEWRQTKITERQSDVYASASNGHSKRSGATS